MDQACFEVWLEGIRSLTSEQRGLGFCELALAEAAEDSDLAVCLLPQDAEAAVPAGADDTPPVVEEPAGMEVDGTAMAEPASLAAAAAQKVRQTGFPHCASQQLQGWGSANGLPRYRCTACRRSFNALTGTPLARLRKKELWPAQAEALITGESLVKAAERCGVAVTTAFRWRHRFLKAAALDKPARLDGIVEADETFILESFKGRRVDLPRAARKRGLSAEQIPILVARDRSGQTTDAVLANLDGISVNAALGGVVTPENQLCCDGGKTIVSFARTAKTPCCILPTPGCPRPEAPNLHINNVNAYHGRLKEASPPNTSIAISAGAAPSKLSEMTQRPRIGCDRRSVSQSANS